MKEISVTDSFMGLNRDTRKCQNVETYDNCNTRLLLENLRKECGCLPLSLILSKKVKECKATIFSRFYMYVTMIGFFMHDEQRNQV